MATREARRKFGRPFTVGESEMIMELSVRDSEAESSSDEDEGEEYITYTSFSGSSRAVDGVCPMSESQATRNSARDLRALRRSSSNAFTPVCAPGNESSSAPGGESAVVPSLSKERGCCIM